MPVLFKIITSIHFSICWGHIFFPELSVLFERDRSINQAYALKVDGYQRSYLTCSLLLQGGS